jgi:hypothetical protein
LVDSIVDRFALARKWYFTVLKKPPAGMWIDASVSSRKYGWMLTGQWRAAFAVRQRDVLLSPVS